MDKKNAVQTHEDVIMNGQDYEKFRIFTTKTCVYRTTIGAINIKSDVNYFIINKINSKFYLTNKFRYYQISNFP